MFDKMKQLYDMQKKARELQKQLESIKFEKASKDNLLRVNVNGTQRIESLSIGAEYLAPEKKEVLERAVRDLVNDALNEIQKQTAAQAASLMKGMPGLLG
jgi:DNA-binding YbaB/EbfC family protein